VAGLPSVSPDPDAMNFFSNYPAMGASIGNAVVRAIAASY